MKHKSFSWSVVVMKVFSRVQTHSEHSVQSAAPHLTRRIKHGRYYCAVPERKCMILTFSALQLSLSRGSGNGGPLVQVSGQRPNERHLSVISVPVLRIRASAERRERCPQLAHRWVKIGLRPNFDISVSAVKNSPVQD